MAQQLQPNGSSSMSNASGEGSESTITLNVKTLDSHIYHFQVDRNILVSAFKEKIATEMGVSVSQQRLIFRGKVLKDDHILAEYHSCTQKSHVYSNEDQIVLTGSAFCNGDADAIGGIYLYTVCQTWARCGKKLNPSHIVDVENGDTLHLVQRQSAPMQPPRGTGSNETSENNGAEATAGAPRNWVGQISHSVVLGTINVGDQGDATLPDVSRVIGTVLNSIGLGGLTPASGGGIGQTPISLSIPGQTPQGIAQERNTGGREAQDGNLAPYGQAVPFQPISSSPHAVQIPLTAAAMPIPSLQAPIPDSLSTLLGFMTRMEQSLAQWSQISPSTSTAQPVSSVAGGVPSVEALSSVLRQAERLLRDHSVATISHIAGYLEREGSSSETTIRGQLQSESSQIGMAMQHLGALFLELGRTMLTLHMGQSPADSFVNAGPAVYISPVGPNPIMVQPFPLQANSVIGGPVPPLNSVAFGPVGVGNPPRNINIHIHAVGGRPGGLEGQQGQGQRGGANGSSNPNAIRSATIPPSPTIISALRAIGPRLVVSASHPHPASAPLSSSLEANPHSTSLAGNPIEGNQTASAGAVVSVENLSASSCGPRNDVVINRAEETKDFSVTIPKNRPEPRHEDKESNLKNTRDPDTVPSVGTSTSAAGSSGSEKDFLESNVPLGLGLGGLERKKRGTNKHRKQSVKDSDGATSTSTNGQQLLQSLLSRGPSQATVPASATSTPESLPCGTQGPAGESNISDVMSEVLHSPALNGLLAGVSEQTGFGSPNDLRSMLQQLTQSPAMMNTMNQIAQQVDSRDTGSMFVGMGGQDGQLDLSRMVQQMMPIVSQAFGGGPIPCRPLCGVNSELQRPSSENRFDREAENRDLNSQMDLEYVARNMENFSYPEDVFKAMAETALRSQGDRNTADNILDAICVEDLGREYAEVLRSDLGRRLQRESGENK